MHLRVTLNFPTRAPSVSRSVCSAGTRNIAGIGMHPAATVDVEQCPAAENSITSRTQCPQSPTLVPRPSSQGAFAAADTSKRDRRAAALQQALDTRLNVVLILDPPFWKWACPAHPNCSPSCQHCNGGMSSSLTYRAVLISARYQYLRCIAQTGFPQKMLDVETVRSHPQLRDHVLSHC